MKDDMAGGAAVLAATQAIAALKLPVNLLTVVPCTKICRRDVPTAPATF